MRWNHNFETVSGYSGREIAGMHPLDFFAEADKPLLAGRIAEVFEKGESSVEASFVSKDGTHRPYFFTGRRVSFEGRTCLVGVGIDITDRKRLEEQMRQAHFAVGDATLSEEDKPFLADFARALSNRPDAVVTVEGFADPQGPSGFNRRLGQRRADAVVEFLASNGMSNSQLRAVSYGEDRNRQVRPGATGPEGLDNRRVSLVIDHAGSAGAPAMN